MYHNDDLKTALRGQVAGDFNTIPVSGEAETYSEAVELVGSKTFEGYDRAEIEPGIET